MFSNINGIFIKVPDSFAGILPVSPHAERFDFEPFAFSGIQKVVRPGDVVFDLGASYGVMSVLMAKLVGSSGKVFSFEANEDVFPYQKQLSTVNGLQDIITFHHCLIGDVSGSEEDFYVIPSFQSVASTRNSEILKAHNDARKTKVQTLAIDDFCNNTGVIPNAIKIDIEGAEYIALKGMENTLRKHRPKLIIETHSFEIDGIGGSVKELAYFLEDLGYSLFDLNNDCSTEAKDYTEKYFNKIGNLLCT